MLVKTTSGSIKYASRYHVAGGEPYEMDSETAKRLIALGVVAEVKDEELDAMTAPEPAAPPPVFVPVAASSASDPEPITSVAASPFGGDPEPMPQVAVAAPKRTRRR